jgi:hypothetical protein
MCKKIKKGLFLGISLLRVNFGDLMMESGLKKGNKLLILYQPQYIENVWRTIKIQLGCKIFILDHYKLIYCLF